MNAAKSPADSRIRTSFVVMPEETNTHGNLFGGALVAHIDRTAAMSAITHCRTATVTASIDRLDFLAPAREGHFIHLDSRVTFVARTSMELLVEVDAEHPLTGERWGICKALLTFVAVDENCRPTPVPPLKVETGEEKQNQQEGQARYEARRQARKSDAP